MSVNDDAVRSVGKKEWISFLANRSNKAALVHYLFEKMKSCNNNVRDSETLIVSIEGNVFEVLSEGTTQIDYLNNNHNESDTRVFFLLSHLQIEKRTWIIRSTDGDLAFIALLNYDKLSLESKDV